MEQIFAILDLTALTPHVAPRVFVDDGRQQWGPSVDDERRDRRRSIAYGADTLYFWGCN
jgi:hypothetical protein